MWRILDALGGRPEGSESNKQGLDALELRTRSTKRSIDKFNGFHALSRDIVERGMARDQRGDGEGAIDYYTKALECIEEGLQVRVDHEDSKILAKRKEMCAWRRALQERVSEMRTRRNVSKSHSMGSVGKKGMGNRSTSSGPSRTANGNEAGTSSEARRMIESSMLDHRPSVRWDDISGLQEAKRSLTEAVVLPSQRPELFRGLRAPTRGILLYGPPGTGKTLLAKALACQARSSFFSISSSSLTSKYMGDSEKMVKELFSCAREKQPSIIFIDEIDSILSQRSADEHEASRRLKSEFLVQFDGMKSSEDRIVCVGATNRPQDLDEAVRRRFTKRIYIPLPDRTCRKDILTKLLKGQRSNLSRLEIQQLVEDTDGYSGADLKALAHEAAMFPIRRLGSRVATVREHEIAPISYKDFKDAMKVQKRTVRDADLEGFETWTREFGMTG